MPLTPATDRRSCTSPTARLSVLPVRIGDAAPPLKNASIASIPHLAIRHLLRFRPNAPPSSFKVRRERNYMPLPISSMQLSRKTFRRDDARAVARKLEETALFALRAALARGAF